MMILLLLFVYKNIVKRQSVRVWYVYSVVFLCRRTFYCVSVIVIEFSISQASAPDRSTEETKNELQGGGSVGGGAVNAVRQCCHVVAVTGTRRLQPAISTRCRCFLFLRNPLRRTWIRSTQQCGRQPPILERSRWPLSINRKYYINNNNAVSYHRC